MAPLFAGLAADAGGDSDCPDRDGQNILILAFVIIVIGGIGSIRGAFLAAIFVGMIDTLGRAFLPDLLRQILSSSAASTAAPALSSMLIYLVMRSCWWCGPEGLFSGPTGDEPSAQRPQRTAVLVVAGLLVLPLYTSLSGNVFALTLFTQDRHFRAGRVEPQSHHGLWRHDELWARRPICIGGYAVAFRRRGHRLGFISGPVALLASALFAFRDRGALLAAPRGVTSS